MNANEVDVGDTVRIIRGDWAQQTGVVTHKSELVTTLEEPKKALLNIRLTNFGRSIQKRNVDIEKTTPAP